MKKTSAKPRQQLKQEKIQYSGTIVVEETKEDEYARSVKQMLSRMEKSCNPSTPTVQYGQENNGDGPSENTDTCEDKTPIKEKTQFIDQSLSFKSGAPSSASVDVEATRATNAFSDKTAEDEKSRQGKSSLSAKKESKSSGSEKRNRSEKEISDKKKNGNPLKQEESKGQIGEHGVSPKSEELHENKPDDNKNTVLFVKPKKKYKKSFTPCCTKTTRDSAKNDNTEDDVEFALSPHNIPE